jgi:cell division protein FtsZ
LLESSIDGARGILFHVWGPADLRLAEVRLAADEIRAAADPDANVIFGASLGEQGDDDVHVTLIATGLDSAKPESADVTPPSTFSRRLRRRAEHVAPHSQVSAPHTSVPGLAGATDSDTVATAGPMDGDLELPTFLRRQRAPKREAG